MMINVYIIPPWTQQLSQHGPVSRGHIVQLAIQHRRRNMLGTPLKSWKMTSFGFFKHVTWLQNPWNGEFKEVQMRVTINGGTPKMAGL